MLACNGSRVISQHMCRRHMYMTSFVVKYMNVHFISNIYGITPVFLVLFIYVSEGSLTFVIRLFRYDFYGYSAFGKQTIM
ncbi:hypothetical protein SAMN04487934_10669 [Eubacterium ruminantium]|nr:hypothetical protein SAMN04487934_10669 [Eubacterium ruminantium]